MPTSAKGPFLLPFKGKGRYDSWKPHDLRIQVTRLKCLCHDTEQEMLDLLSRFDQTFGPQRPAYLALHNTGTIKAIRWRRKSSTPDKQNYFEMIDSDYGLALLRESSAPVKEVYLAFEQTRLKLNLVYALYRHEQKRLQRYLDSLSIIARIG